MYFFLLVTNFAHLKHALACINRTLKNALFHGKIARFPWKHHQPEKTGETLTHFTLKKYTGCRIGLRDIGFYM
jgi:hypothetical protein